MLNRDRPMPLNCDEGLNAKHSSRKECWAQFGSQIKGVGRFSRGNRRMTTNDDGLPAPRRCKSPPVTRDMAIVMHRMPAAGRFGLSRVACTEPMSRSDRGSGRVLLAVFGCVNGPRKLLDVPPSRLVISQAPNSK
jgi:hypothetical protein